MSSSTPAKPISVGIVFALLGALALAFSLLAAYGSWLAVKADHMNDTDQIGLFLQMGGMSLLGLLIAGTLIYFGVRVLGKLSDYFPKDALLRF